MSGRSSRKSDEAPKPSSSRYDDSFFGLLESTISDSSRKDREKHSRSRERSDHGSRRSGESSRDLNRRRRRSSERNQRSRSPQQQPRKKKPSFLEEMQQMYPDIRNEIEARDIESNMKALQMFGMQIPQPNIPPPFYPNFPVQDPFTMQQPGGYYAPPMNANMVPIMEVPLPVEPVPPPNMPKFSIGMNPEPPGSFDPVQNSNDGASQDKADTPAEIDMSSATKKAFEEGNIGLSDFLRQRVLENKKKMEVTNIQVKKKQVLDRSKRALQMIEDVQKGKIILPLYFKHPTKDLSTLKQNQALAKRSPLSISNSNLKFSWQTHSMDAFQSNPCSNISGEILTLARNVPMDLCELSQRAKTRAKIEKNKAAQAAKNAVTAPIPVVEKPTIKRSNYGVQTDPLICISCDERARTLITTQGTQTDFIERKEVNHDHPVEPGTFKFQLNRNELGMLNNEQRYAFIGFCKAFNMNYEDFVNEPEPLPIELNHIMPMQNRRSPPAYSGRNLSPPRRSRSHSRPFSDHQQLMMNQSPLQDRQDDFRHSDYSYGQRSGSPNSPRRSCAFQRLGQKVPSDSPRKIIERPQLMDRPQRFYNDEENVVVIPNDRFIDPRHDSRSRSPFAPSHMERSRSPRIFDRLEPPTRSRSPPISHQRYISPQRNASRDYISPHRNERIDYNYEDEEDYMDRERSPDRRNFNLSRSRSPVRMVNGVPTSHRNDSPPPLRRRSPDRISDYSNRRRNDSPPPRPYVDRQRDRSRSSSPKSGSNWFSSSRRDIPSGSSNSGGSRFSARPGRY